MDIKGENQNRGNKRSRQKQHDEIQAHPDITMMTIYTDGSGIENKIWAAAYTTATNDASLQHPGSEAQFNVYTAELTAVHLAIKLLGNHVEYRTCRIYIDSQAAIRAIDRPRRKSGQSIIRDILDSIDEITNKLPHLRFEVIWISGHTEIEGNELVDAEAKKAALDPILSQPHNYKPLKSAQIRHIKTAAKQTTWNTNTKTVKALRRIMKGRHAKIGPVLYNENLE
jgi:ribonuclease HI